MSRTAETLSFLPNPRVSVRGDVRHGILCLVVCSVDAGSMVAWSLRALSSGGASAYQTSVAVSLSRSKDIFRIFVHVSCSVLHATQRNTLSAAAVLCRRSIVHPVSTLNSL